MLASRSVLTDISPILLCFIYFLFFLKFTPRFFFFDCDFKFSSKNLFTSREIHIKFTNRKIKNYKEIIERFSFFKENLKNMVLPCVAKYVYGLFFCLFVFWILVCLLVYFYYEKVCFLMFTPRFLFFDYDFKFSFNNLFTAKEIHIKFTNRKIKNYKEIIERFSFSKTDEKHGIALFACIKCHKKYIWSVFFVCFWKVVSFSLFFMKKCIGSITFWKKIWKKDIFEIKSIFIFLRFFFCSIFPWACSTFYCFWPPIDPELQ